MAARSKGNPVGFAGSAILAQGLFLVAAFGFFFSMGHYVLVVQESRSLFLFSADYLRPFLSEPGGLLRYGGTFLTQFYASEFLGPLVVAVGLILPAILLHMLSRRLFPGRPASWLLLLLPSCLLLVTQTNPYHEMGHTLGFLLVLAVYFGSYILFLSSGNPWRRAMALGLVPLFYYLAGAYVWVLTGLLIVHSLVLEKGKHRYLFIALLVSIATLSFLLFWKVLFIQSALRTLLSPFPTLENPAYGVSLVAVTGYVVAFPLLATTPMAPLSSKMKAQAQPRLFGFARVMALAVIVWLVSLEYEPEIRRVVELEELAHAGKWEEVIALQEREPSSYRVGQYLYNTALSETDQLCDRLFSGRQDFGPDALFLPWAVDHLANGALFYYAVGLMNEAHRWAFEDMVVFGYRSRNLKMLAKTSLLNGDHGMARKYLHLLKETLFYRDWAAEYETLANEPGLIPSRPELAEKLAILPKTNFFVEYTEPERTLTLLLQGQPDNRKALEYLLAGGLLAQNVEFAAGGIRALTEAGYSRIPRHLEEAALAQFSITEVMPDLGGLAIRDETQARFQRFSASYAAARRHPSSMREELQGEFGDTFWYYFFFAQGS